MGSCLPRQATWPTPQTTQLLFNFVLSSLASSQASVALLSTQRDFDAKRRDAAAAVAAHLRFVAAPVPWFRLLIFLRSVAEQSAPSEHTSELMRAYTHTTFEYAFQDCLRS